MVKTVFKVAVLNIRHAHTCTHQGPNADLIHTKAHTKAHTKVPTPNNKAHTKVPTLISWCVGVLALVIRLYGWSRPLVSPSSNRTVQ